MSRTLRIDKGIYIANDDSRTYSFLERNKDWLILDPEENELSKRSIDGYARIFRDGTSKVFSFQGMNREQGDGSSSLEDVLGRLKKKARPDRLAGMVRYGIAVEHRLGLSIPDLRRLAKDLGKNHKLALELWHTGIAEARILAAMIGEPENLTETQMEGWVKDINSWDVCDQVCLNLFQKTPLAWKKIRDWSVREEEFIKRAAFALIACLAWSDKKAKDQKFMELFPLIIKGATDERNFVKKAVNWALRNMGKRNRNLNRSAIDIAREIQRLDLKAARWIASDAIRELESEAVQRRFIG